MPSTEVPTETTTMVITGSTHPYASLPTPTTSAAPITEFRNEHRFLSNFWFVPGGLRVGGMSGPTVEHVFQAIKTLDPVERAGILAEPKPGNAKKLGRNVTLRPDWEPMKIGVMARLQAAKYTQPEMARLLLATGDAEIIEGNHWCDTFWGKCNCARHDFEGLNWLGRILMLQRSVLNGAAL